MMKIAASIQARMMSTRLPGKVLADLGGKPMLLFQIERLKTSSLIDDVVVATSTNPADDAIADMCSSEGIGCFRGDENDVLSRVAEAVRFFDIELHIECFGDSPLIDPGLVDEMIRTMRSSTTPIDIVTNCHKSTYPAGMEAYIYRADCLHEINARVSLDDTLREHCGFNLLRHRDLFSVLEIEASENRYNPGLFLEVDEPSDLETLRRIHHTFLAKGMKDYRLDDILALAQERPDLFSGNQDVHRRWKDVRNDYGINGE